MGVQATNAYYAESGAGHLMDLFAKSEPGQNIVVKGSGVSQTRMREDAKVPGRYFARVFADGAPPSDLSVTNVTDAPDTTDHIELSMFGDKVHIASAVYSNDTRTLNVSAQSGDSAAVLKLDGFPSATGTVDPAGVTNWSVPTLAVPPSEVMVTSDKGGVDTEDVVITGAETRPLASWPPSRLPRTLSRSARPSLSTAWRRPARSSGMTGRSRPRGPRSSPSRRTVRR
jgi:hypothetical protein